MTETVEMIDPMTGETIDQKELAEALLEQARDLGVTCWALVGCWQA
jgi:hypothetical protein